MPTTGRVRRIAPTFALTAVCLAAPILGLSGCSRDLLGKDAADTQRRVSQHIALGTPIAAAVWRLKTGGYNCYPARGGQLVCAHQNFFGFTFWSVTLTLRAGRVSAVKTTTSHTAL